MFTMESADDQEFLTLSLAVSTDNSDCRSSHMKRKRKRSEVMVYWDLNDSSEGKIFNLLETRDQMLNLEKKMKTDGSSLCVENGKGLHLIHSLLISATSVDGNDIKSSADNLCDLYQNISLFGDSLQRVAAYFADGLVAKILTRKSPFYDMIMKNPTPKEEFLAYTQFYKVSPVYQFAHFSANQSIIEAFEKDQEKKTRNNISSFLHVIDFDVSYGFQWPSLIRSLSELSTCTKRVSLKITGFGRSTGELQDTKRRLTDFAKEFPILIFEFQGLLHGSKAITSLRKKKGETLAVNLVFHLNSMNITYPKVTETLKSIHFLNPSLVVMAEQDSNRNYQQNFLPRFMESLHYFAAMFDSLDDCLPADSPERLSVEKNHLGKEIKNVMNFDKDNSFSSTICPKLEKTGTWKERMENHGFKGNKLSSKTSIQARLLLKIRSNCSPVKIDGENGGFRIFEKDDSKTISLGWQDRSLVTVSTWRSVGISQC